MDINRKLDLQSQLNYFNDKKCKGHKSVIDGEKKPRFLVQKKSTIFKKKLNKNNLRTEYKSYSWFNV